MPFEVAFSEEALGQLSKLEDYLSRRFYPANVERYLQRLAKACESLGDAPHRGKKRDDLGLGVRVVGFERNVSIYFTLIGTRVVVVGVGYGGRTPELRTI